MLALQMLYAVLIGSAVVTAASLFEGRVHLRRRLLWTLALVGAVALPPLLKLLPTPGGGVGVEFGAIRPIVAGPAGRLGSAVVAGSERLGLDLWLALAWAGASLVLLGLLATGVVWTLRRRRGWRPVTLDGVPVLVSRDVGPAVVGLRRPVVVVPEWVLERPAEERRLVLAHELEHLRARDPSLMAAAYALAALAPWNVPLWWAFARFRDAVETDCDARVLARERGAARRYVELLLESSTRIRGRVPVGAGFGERRSSLERRVRAMLGMESDRSWGGHAVRAALAAAVVVGACSLENITGPQEPSSPEVAPTVSVYESLSDKPQFTPFTVAPSILNRQEVVEAMQSEYPPLLREAGIGGTVRVYFFIGEDGLVKRRLVDESSGHPALDEAALRVAATYRFEPALNKDQKVPVWVSFPITFQVR